MIIRAAAENREATLHRVDNSSRVGKAGGGWVIGWEEWQHNKNKLRVVSTDCAAIFAACDSTLFGIRESGGGVCREMSASVPAR